MLLQIVEEVDVRFKGHINDVLALIKEKLTHPSLPAMGGNTALIGEPVAETGEDANVWGEEEPADYLEEEFEEGVDDFVPDLELDEAADQND
jgi:hypothetical protein